MAQYDSSLCCAKPGPIYQLGVADLFAHLTKQERLYAHHMARASWHGARIILRQTSPEAVSIFDLIMSLHRACEGDWIGLGQRLDIENAQMDAFLAYAACFLSNIGNYYGAGDQKFIPDISRETLRKLCDGLVDEHTQRAIMAVPPYNLGFPGQNSQSSYYPGPHNLSKDEISKISRLMELHGILPENTRLSKNKNQVDGPTYKILQASVASDPEPVKLASHLLLTDELSICIQRGDHKNELSKICEELSLAVDYAANDTQRRTIGLYVESFETGDLEKYREALRSWVRDLTPRVEHSIGFIESYRDPSGTRAEFGGLVAIADPEESKNLLKLVEHSDKYIKELPWCVGQGENNGKGPFEKSLFEPPDFSSIHVIAYCSSIIFTGINLPNYDDIRESCGFKNVIIANRMATEASSSAGCSFIAAEEVTIFQKHRFATYYIWTVLHELLGHGTGKMLCQLSDGKFNFDNENPPTNPLTHEPVNKWYQPGQTWTGQFEELATTVDECRADLVGAYLMDNKELLALFGFTDHSEITADDLTYNIYMQLATEGLRGLQNFNADNATWGQAHCRGQFAILKCLIRDGAGSVNIELDSEHQRLTVRVQRSRIIPYAKAALERMLLRLHMYRCTADVVSCRQYYEDLSSVEGEYLEWRRIVVANQQPEPVFVQPNTFLENGDVVLKEYEATPSGVIESWVGRVV